MLKIAKKVYVINNTPELGGEAVVREKIEKSPIATVLNDSVVKAVLGEKMVNAIKIETKGKEQTLAVQGVFVEIGLLPNSDFAGELKRNPAGEIIVNSRNETNIPGIFAAGDVTDVPEKQIIIAAGEGSKACLSAFRYLSSH